MLKIWVLTPRPVTEWPLILKPKLNSNVILIPQRSTRTLQIITHRDNTKKPQTRINHKTNAKPQVLPRERTTPKKASNSLYHKKNKKSQTCQINKKDKQERQIVERKTAYRDGESFYTDLHLIYFALTVPAKPGKTHIKWKWNMGTYNKNQDASTPTRSGLHLCHWIIKTSGRCDCNGQ